jgi:hypothetical protein
MMRSGAKHIIDYEMHTGNDDENVRLINYHVPRLNWFSQCQLTGSIIRKKTIASLLSEKQQPPEFKVRSVFFVPDVGFMLLRKCGSHGEC